jgi:hypothetical protein
LQETAAVRLACCLDFAGKMLLFEQHAHCWHRALLLLLLLVQEDEEEGMIVVQRLPGKQEPK